MSKRIFPSLIVLPVLALVFSSRMEAAELHVDKTASNRVKFTASYAGQTFEGSTPKIDGYVFWKSADPEAGRFEGSDLYFEVDLNSLDTGIGLRNRHMREDHLETDKFPYASFKGKLVKAARPGGADFLVNAEGVMRLHGADKAIAVTGRVRVDGERYHLSCTFPLDIREFGIEVPSLMGMKVAAVLDMDVDAALVKVK